MVSRRGFLTLASSLPAAPQAPRPAARRRPNILFFFPDQLRPDWFLARKNLPLETPNLASLAKSGMQFTRTLVSSPLCAPSRACLATGKDYARAGVRNNGQDLPLDQPTFYQVLRESGYHVMGCGKFDLHKATPDWGIDGRRFLPEWGFSDGVDSAGKMDAIASGAAEPRDPYMAYLHRRGLATAHVEDFRRRTGNNSYLNTEPSPLPEEAYCDNWIAARGLDLLRRAPSAKPWFLQINFAGPHNPVDITRRMERTVRRRQFPEPEDYEEHSVERHNAVRQNYTAMVENIDRWLGIYTEELRKRGELDNTLIFFSSDHGEMLGDHDRWGKSVPYQPSVAVPLLVAGPGVSQAFSSDALIAHYDLAATFLDFASAPRLADSSSLSIRPLLQRKATTHREYLLSALDRWQMVFDGRYKLIRGFDTEPPAKGKPRTEPRPMLFDLKLDPNETSNIAREAPHQVERLSKLLL
ncbi:MAG: sulfatase-like hydrolase/transferase [Bryobacterales bacterium]|nr:sulfatase-like hydrolase/transferase [Bryobacterales bacterium]